ncbi:MULTISPECIES: DUF3606 domain-containing protein [unclassified Variovorax]|uniref:DUF3606 domain-containing protein n=1 Tax=unclassified Variovorax TaxID=663243 RepID=UPI003F48BDE6
MVLKKEREPRYIATPSPALAKEWAKRLGCTPAELRIALRAVGDSTERVRAYLEALNQRHPS